MASEQLSFKQRFGEQLRRARLMRGLSLRELAEKLGGEVSHAALQKYEKGKMSPDSQLLHLLCASLNIRPDYFFNRQPVELAGIEFRKRSKLSQKAQLRIHEEAREFFERYLEIETILELKSPELKGIEVSTLEDVEGAAEQIRDSWKLGRNPLSNVHELLETRGVKVKEIEAEQSFDGFSGWAGSVPVIVLAKWLNDDTLLPRKRLTALHELGHLVLKLPESLTPKEVEAWCYRLAGALLIPEAEFRKALGGTRNRLSTGELVALKEEWGMSIAAITRRAHDLGLITDSRYKYSCITANKLGWGKTKPEPGEWQGSESAHRFPMLVYQAAAKELITRSKAAGLLGLALVDFDENFTLI